MSSLKRDAIEIKDSTKLNSWHLSLALHILIIIAIFQLTFKTPIAEMPDNKGTIELVFVTAKPDYREIKDLLTIKKDKILFFLYTSLLFAFSSAIFAGKNLF